jgi:dihydrofolate reductase
MRVNIIVAAAENSVIGRDGDLPWRISADLKRFKQITMGHPVVMGRKTFESLPKVLPGRKNIVVTRQQNYLNEKLDENCLVVNSLDVALSSFASSAEIMVIGGAAIYEEALPIAKRLFMTEVHEKVVGDVSFPAFVKQSWTETLRSPRREDASSVYPYSFVVLERA